MIEYLVRFACGGLLVATLPLVAAKFGDTVAGVLLLFPVITVVGLAALGVERGMGAVSEAAVGSVFAVPIVAVFLVSVHFAARAGWPLLWTLAASVGAWLLAALAFLAARAAA